MYKILIKYIFQNKNVRVNLNLLSLHKARTHTDHEMRARWMQLKMALDSELSRPSRKPWSLTTSLKWDLNSISRPCLSTDHKLQTLRCLLWSLSCVITFLTASHTVATSRWTTRPARLTRCQSLRGQRDSRLTAISPLLCVQRLGKCLRLPEIILMPRPNSSRHWTL